MNRYFSNLIFRSLFKATLLLYLVLGVHSAYADIATIDTRFRLTYDPVLVAAREEMGLLGTTVLFQQKRFGLFHFDVGLGIYSAVSGQRGGFFTGGLALNTSIHPADWIIEAGLFIGGGGGDAAPQGGGLMLRPHFSILYDFEKFSLGLTIDQIVFPNGEIDSKQVGVQIEMPYQLAFLDDMSLDIKKLHLGWDDLYIAPTLQWYDPRPGVKNTRGLPVSKKTQLVGIEFGRFISESAFIFLESAGAFKGETDGYAEFLGGFGARFSLSKRFFLRFKGAIGSAGGGRVDTEGGGVVKGAVGVSFGLMPNFSIAFDYGWVDALEGSFSATMMKTLAIYQFEIAVPDRDAEALEITHLKQGRWAVRASVLRYLSSGTLRKNGQNDAPVDLFALKLDRYVSPHFYLTGQAGAAYRGKAGGYATGAFGVGAQRPLSQKIVLVGEVLVGAGGGGGIASGGGAIVQPMLGFRYQFTKKQGLQVMAGRIDAPGGTLDASVVDVGWVYQFDTLERR